MSLPKVTPEQFQETMIRAFERAIIMPPDFNGPILWGNPESRERQRREAWERYDLKQRLAGLGAIV